MSSRPVKTAQQANANWKAAMASPTTSAKYTQGVNAVTESPNAKAASPEAQAKYLRKVTDAVQSGRMAQKNSAVGVQKWKDAASKGAARLSTGATNGAQNHMDAATRMQPGWQAARDAANAIPNDGSEQAIAARVLASVREMKRAAGRS